MQTFILIVDDFLKSRVSLKYLDEIELNEFDKNFIRALSIWLNYKDKSYLNVEQDCVPIICLHTALFYKNKNLKEKSDEYFEKIEIKSLPLLGLKKFYY